MTDNSPQLTLDTIADHLPVLVVYLDREHRYRYVNHTYEQWHGRPRTQIVGRHVRELLGEATYEAIRPRIERALAGERVSFEAPHPYHDGSQRLLRVDYVPDRQDGEVRGLVAHIADISELRQAEAALHLKEQAMTHARNGMAMADLEGRLVYVNPAFLRMWGYADETPVLGRPATAFWEAPEAAAGVIATLMRDGQWSGELEALRGDGSHFLAGLNAALIPDVQGRPTHLVASFEDVTQREKIFEQVELFQRIAEATGQGIGFSDLDATVRYFNPALRRMLAVPEDADLTRYTFNDFHGEPQRETLRREIRPALQTLGCWTGELDLRALDGRIVPTLHNALLIRCPDGTPRAYANVITDLTEQRRAEAALKRSEETYARAEAIAHIGSWDWDIVSGGLRWTDEIYRIFGQAPQAFGATYQAFLETIHPEDRQKVIDAVNACVADAAVPYDIEHRVVRRDGEIRIVHERGKVYRDEHGTPLRMIGTVHDISERRQAEEELARYREHLEELVRARTADLREAQRIARLGHWTVDVESGELQWSDEIYQIFGRDPADFQPSYDNFHLVVHPEDRERVLLSEQESMRSGVHSIDHRILLPDGGIRWVHEEARAECNPQGTLVRMSGTVQDITERKQAEQALIVARDEAQRANRAKNDFLSRMSHELRTPMNAILGFSQVLEMESLSPDQREFVQEIHTAGEHLLELINELLDLSRIEAGQLAVAITTVDLGQTVAQAVQLVQPLLSSRQISLVNRCTGEVAVLADVTRLRQVLVNLLSNAAKYNRDGGRVAIDCHPAAGERLHITVSDTGPGIAADKLDSLFIPFERLGAEFSAVDGTGIGLALCRQLMDLMGGDIGVASTPGQDTSVWIELPLAGVAAATPPATEPGALPAAGRTTVLYVEDNAANLRLVEAMLRLLPDVTLLSAGNGEYGLELAQRYRPDAILLDIHLPGMDGYAVLRALQADPGTRDIPVIALSADAMPLDVERGFKAGFRDYLTKPVLIPDLMAALQAVTQAHSPRP